MSGADVICNIRECNKQDISCATLICNLPECIKHKILIYLPIKDAIKTCILSKNWRHTWSTIPDLIVDYSVNSNPHQNHGREEESRNEKFVDQLFSCHRGNLNKFKLSGLELGMVDIKPWMQILSQKQISELILEACTNKFEVSFGIDCCLKLKVLVLSRCFIALPLKFDGFKLIHTIDLRDCSSFQKSTIERLISLCPLLEKLKFKPTCYDDEVIQIHSSNLRELTIYGKNVHVSLLTPGLCTAYFVTTSRTIGLRGNIIKLPINIYDIEPCDAFCYFLKYPSTLNYLTTMIMILESPEHRLYFAYESIQRVPMLQKLVAYLEPSHIPSGYKIRGKTLPCLKEATIIPYENSEVVMFEFAEFLLSCSPLLERITIRGEVNDCEVSKLNEIRKLSTTAEIIFHKSCFNADGKFEGCCCSMCDIVAW
ncbi:F-box/RNI/FBD-like domain protein [Rhynchospora pubera]|uniref:F-box/RNI/FBD-like domain protein n=1 Tax=Rhynchospora pubera TaxID=906938 RepID=A0AAV8G3E3_9POAL|nr:F-box/RNI/FBD-like domain protein [Rhynchospora pubera]